MGEDITEAPVRPGVYARGAEAVDAILSAALKVLIEEGATSFTVRRIAAACGMKVGNVSYHFPRKEMLIKLLLDELIESYDMKLERTVRQSLLAPEDQLRLVITFCLDDISTERTTHLFTELLALANHEDFIAERVRLFYKKVHEVIAEYIEALNPALSEDEAETLALFISASMEGTTPFLGYRKPWADKMPAITGISAKWFVHLAKTIKPGEIADLTRVAA